MRPCVRSVFYEYLASGRNRSTAAGQRWYGQSAFHRLRHNGQCVDKQFKVFIERILYAAQPSVSRVFGFHSARWSSMDAGFMFCIFVVGLRLAIVRQSDAYRRRQSRCVHAADRHKWRGRYSNQ